MQPTGFRRYIHCEFILYCDETKSYTMDDRVTGSKYGQYNVFKNNWNTPFDSLISYS